MKNIPMFTTEFGIASLILKEVPYLREAYIRLQTTAMPKELIAECVGFCRACGAENIYATGHGFLENYPLHTAVLQLQCETGSIPPTDAALFPVLPETAQQWRTIYNKKMASVPNASYMTENEGKNLPESGAYFVHRGGELLGIGKITENKIDAIASVTPGAGKDIVLALSSLVTEDLISLEVASTNTRALRIYKELGFYPVRELSKWYKVFPSG